MANNLFDKIMGKIPVEKPEAEVPAPETEEQVLPAEDTDSSAVVQESTQKIKQVTTLEVTQPTVQHVEKEIVQNIEEAEKEAAQVVTEEAEKEAAQEVTEEAEKEAAQEVAEEATEEPVQEPLAQPKTRKADSVESSEPKRPVLLEQMLKTKEAAQPAKDSAGKQTAPEAEKVEGYPVYLELVLDNTISMQLYYKVLYKKLYDLLNGLSLEAERLSRRLELRMGITYIRPEAPVEETSFSENGYTTDVIQVLNSLRNITFSGGGLDGYENINGAIRLALSKLKNAVSICREEEKKECACGILVITDSLPCAEPGFSEDPEEALLPDYTDEIPVNFAWIMAYDDFEYAPQFAMSSDYGKQTEEGACTVRYRKLEDLLQNPSDLVVRIRESILSV